MGFEMPDWGGVFVPDMSLLESFLRGSVVYLSILILFRMMLKRQAGSLGLPDVMLAVLVSECASNALPGEARSVPNALAAVSALLFWNYTLDRLGHRWPWLQRLLEPQPLPVVRDGEPVRENLDAEGITDEELKAQLREHGIDDVSRVKLAMVEADGSVSVIPKDDEEPPAPPGSAPHRDESPDFEKATERFLAAAEELRAAVAWHEERAAGHRAAARAARELLARHGVRAAKAVSPAESPSAGAAP